jgi:hypothetical protein
MTSLDDNDASLLLGFTIRQLLLHLESPPNPNNRMVIMALPGAIPNSDPTSEALPNLNEEGLDHQAEITGEASEEITEESPDHQADLTGEASPKLDEDICEALLWMPLGRGRRSYR